MTPLPHAGRRAGSVLLADDDPEMRRMLARALRKWGYSVLEAHDGAHLAALLDTLVLRERDGPLQIDVVVSDVRMPGASGLQSLAHVRRAGGAVPMILMTAFGDPELHLEARQLGAAAVFDKPFDVDDLCTAILNVLE
jgi:CheY-like chemotaxis protein